VLVHARLPTANICEGGWAVLLLTRVFVLVLWRVRMRMCVRVVVRPCMCVSMRWARAKESNVAYRRIIRLLCMWVWARMVASLCAGVEGGWDCGCYASDVCVKRGTMDMYACVAYVCMCGLFVAFLKRNSQKKKMRT